MGAKEETLIEIISPSDAGVWSVLDILEHSLEVGNVKWRILRIIYVFLMGFAGYLLAVYLDQPEDIRLACATAGLAGACLMVVAEYLLERMSLKGMVVAGTGLFIGLLMAFLVANVVQTLMVNVADLRILQVIKVLSILLLGYLGIQAFRSKKDEFFLLNPALLFKGIEHNVSVKLLDTSVIIDGRIEDLCKVGFMEGLVIVPRFILRELQGVADSQDSLRRNRGRRGLDVLNALQQDPHIEVQIHDQDFPELEDMDAKLVKLGQIMKAKIVTTDFGLGKLAALQGVGALNINELCNAIKPVVLPGEVLTVTILKEGKEPGQGVGYLDDGTMVVVEDGRHHMNEEIHVIVTSVLQTSAGRMIFAKAETSSPRTARRKSYD